MEQSKEQPHVKKPKPNYKPNDINITIIIIVKHIHDRLLSFKKGSSRATGILVLCVHNEERRNEAFTKVHFLCKIIQSSKQN